MKKVILPIVIVLVALAGFSAPSFARADPIILVENPWTASSLNVNVAKLILEKEMGYKVETILLDESTQWAAIGAGDAHASLEVWPSGHQKNIEQYINELGVVVNGGPLGPVGKIGWYIPTYMLEDHPELATWEGFLDPDNAALFATAETGKKGQFLAGAPGWTQYDEQIIKNLGLNLEVVYAGSEEAILAAVESAYRREDPILFYFWTPHSIHAEYDLTEVKLPEYTDECYEGVSEGDIDGVACDYPADELFKIFWAGLEEAYPDVFTFLSNMHYTTEDQISMVAAVELDGLTPEEAAEAWVKDHEDVWREWLPDAN
jgi:glycine betaine/proline transport system substrate-binding protein